MPDKSGGFYNCKKYLAYLATNGIKTQLLFEEIKSSQILIFGIPKLSKKNQLAFLIYFCLQEI